MSTMIGLSNVVYAALITDPASGTATYDVIKNLKGAITAKINPNASHETLFADDGPYETGTSIGQITLELNVADLPLEVQADLFGHTMSGGVLVRKSSDVPPWVAVGFKSLKANGKYRYTWLAKGKFSLPEQANETKADKIKFQTPTTTGSFVKRDCDNEWERHVDEDSPSYVASLGANWFNNPYGGSAGPTALTVTVSPSNNATAVADAGTNVVWTFSNTVSPSSVNAGTVMLVKDTDGSAVAGTLSVSGTAVTFTPSAAFAAATAYRAIATTGIKDIYGNALSAASVTKFTTV